MAIVLDLFHREVVGGSLKPRMTADRVGAALTRGWLRRQPAPGLIHPSDRGSPYASQAFQAHLAPYGRVCSMSRQGQLLGQRPDQWHSKFGSRFLGPPG